MFFLLFNKYLFSVLHKQIFAKWSGQSCVNEKGNSQCRSFINSAGTCKHWQLDNQSIIKQYVRCNGFTNNELCQFPCFLL